MWDPTFGRGRQRSEGRTPGHLRGARRDVRRPPSIPGGSRRTERRRCFRNHRFNDREGQGTTFPLRNQQKKFRTANALKVSGGNRADSAVSVRSTAGLAALPIRCDICMQLPLCNDCSNSTPSTGAMASRSATRNCQVGVRSVAEAPSWLKLYHGRSGRRRKASSCLAPERSGGAKQLTRLSLGEGPSSYWLVSVWSLATGLAKYAIVRSLTSLTASRQLRLKLLSFEIF